MDSNKAKIIVWIMLLGMAACTFDVPTERHRGASECIVDVRSHYVHDGIPKFDDVIHADGPYTESSEVPATLKVEETVSRKDARYFKRPGAVVIVVGTRVKAMFLTDLGGFCVAGRRYEVLDTLAQRLISEGYRQPVSRWLPDTGTRLEVFNSAFITFAFQEPAIDGVSVAILDIDQFHDREELRKRLSEYDETKPR